MVNKCVCGKSARSVYAEYCKECYIINKRYIEKISQRKRRAKLKSKGLCNNKAEENKTKCRSCSDKIKALRVYRKLICLNR